MNKIFEHSKDLHVVATVLYTKDDDTYLYSNSEKTEKISKSDLEEVFIKGMLIQTATGFVRPVSLSVISGEDGYSSVSWFDGTALVVMYSKEYSDSDSDAES